MSEIKRATREEFEEEVKKSKIAQKAYEALGNFSARSGIFSDPVKFPRSEGDYIFCQHMAVCRLYDRDMSRAINLPYLERLTQQREDEQENHSGVGFVYLGLKIFDGKEISTANIGCTVSEKTLEEEVSRNEWSSGFWPWDEIIIEQEKDEKQASAEIWLHGDSPRELSTFVSRGLLDSVYQHVLSVFEVPQGKINVRYSGGTRPRPVLYPGYGRTPWIGS